MKIFDFTNGTKGDLLGDITIANSTGGSLVEKNGSTFKVELANPQNVDPVAGGKAGIKWTWHRGATNLMEGKDHAIKAEDFGVGAICFLHRRVLHCFGMRVIQRRKQNGGGKLSEPPIGTAKPASQVY